MKWQVEGKGLAIWLVIRSRGPQSSIPECRDGCVSLFEPL